MEKLYIVKLELHGKVHTSCVKAQSDVAAVAEARALVKDDSNAAHVMDVSACTKRIS